KVPNIESVVPMGIDFATFSSVGELDRALSELRRAVMEKNEPEIAVLGGQIQQLAKLMEDKLKNDLKVSKEKQKIELGLDHLKRVESDEFWSDQFKNDTTNALEFLDTEVAPLAADGRLQYLRYVGTD